MNTTSRQGKPVFHLALVFLVLAGTGTAAMQLELPANARQTAARDSALASVAVPTGPYDADKLPQEIVEGIVQRRAYRLPTQGLTPLQILAPLRSQLEAAGYETTLDCDQGTCGGFDFRFAIDVLPAPGMYVNIRKYHYLSARSADADVVMLLASTADNAAYLQVVTVRKEERTSVPGSATLPQEQTAGFSNLLLSQGSIVLESLDFAVGTTTLADTPSPELEELAQLLQARPGLEIALVGHTDTVGALETNISVSRTRAEAVRKRLIENYEVNPNQLRAEGMGYLAPRASNLTDEGREANRRVEAIVVREK